MDITEFIRTYGKPYDPTKDAYDVPPFQRNFENASKASKIYNMHIYWTKQDPYVVREFIEHYTQPGDIVLDAFCGTGMTGVAAILARDPQGNHAPRHSLLFDISPVCVHIAHNYITPIDVRAFAQAAQRLKSAFEAEIRPLYRTSCHSCGNRNAQIANTILSDVYTCPRCKSDVLFAGDGRWEMMKRGEAVETLACGVCQYRFRKGTAKFTRVEPVEIRVACDVCKIKGQAKAKPLDEADWRLYVEIEGGFRFVNKLGQHVLECLKAEQRIDAIPAMDVIYWYPKEVEFPVGYNTRQPMRRGIKAPWQMFTRRNLAALAMLWYQIGRIESKEIRAKMRFAFTGIVFLATMMYSWRVRRTHGVIEEDVMGRGGVRKGTLYIPSLIQDMNVVQLFTEKIKRIEEGLVVIGPANGGQGLAEVRSAINLPEGIENTVDYLYYDPPYGRNINYSELNIVWEAWLNEFTAREMEILENEFQGKGREDYEKAMMDSLREAFRVLKPGRWLTLVYSYADPSMYRTVQRMAHQAGFLDQGEVLHVDSSAKTMKQMDSDKSQQRYLVINFKKPKNGERRFLPDAEDIEYNVITAVQQFLQTRGAQTRDVVYDEVIKRLFATVQIEQFDLDEILRNFFRKVGDKWYAPGSLVSRQDDATKTGQLRLAFDTSDDPEMETVLRLQDFLAQHGTVPLSELREYYLREIPFDWQERVNFDRAIEGFMVKESKVRLPTPEEQRLKQDVRARYRTREIRKFLEGTLGRQPTDVELCGWVEFCYQLELFPEAIQLFSHIDAAFVDAELYKKTRDLFEVCKLRSE